MDFGDAIKAAREGARIARAGWNGKNMYVLFVDPYRNKGFDITEKPGLEGTLYPYFAIKTAQNKLVPWQPSQTDMVDADWDIVPTPAHVHVR